MAKVRYVVLVPLTYNDGSEVAKEVRERIFDDLFLLAGGYRIGGTGKGAYRMHDGSKQIDVTMEVWVVVEEEDQVALRELVEKFCVMLKQESMYLERVHSSVDFVSPSSRGD